MGNLLTLFQYLYPAKLGLALNNSVGLQIINNMSNNQKTKLLRRPIAHFTVVCLVAWPLNENEAGGDLVLIETSLFFICKLLLISMRRVSLT